MINFNHVKVGNNPPNDINVVVEIPKGSNIKYEIDREIGLFLLIENIHINVLSWKLWIHSTVSRWGWRCRSLFSGEVSILPTAVVNTRPIGVLITEDEKERILKSLLSHRHM